MTIHYPTGNRSETSSFRFQMELPRQIRISFAVGCCTFWRVQTCNAACCICFSSAAESVRFTPKCKGPNGCSGSAEPLFWEVPKARQILLLQVCLGWPKGKDRIRFYTEFWHNHSHQTAKCCSSNTEKWKRGEIYFSWTELPFGLPSVQCLPPCCNCDGNI